MNIYPAIFVFAAAIKSVFLFYELLSGWSQSIRDKEFLVELRLKNHEPEAPAPKDASSLASGSDERTQTVQGAEALEAVEELQPE
jgi:E3 ubiquitin-protein ligase MARCH6